MNDFIKYFSKHIGNFELTLNNNGNISKLLFYFKNNDYYIIHKYLKEIFGKNNYIDEIFNLYGTKINHIGFDKSSSNKYKFYISLYNENFENSLEIIKTCKDILLIKDKYYLEKDFLKFDCIGFDVSKKGIDMKIYELVKNENNFYLLPSYIEKQYVKEIGYLKTFSGRKKKFFRFNSLIDIVLFSNNFNLYKIEYIKKEIKDFYILQKKVKYFCVEGEKKEIYFI